LRRPTPSTRYEALWLGGEREPDARSGELQAGALGRGNELDRDAILVLHEHAGATACQRGARAHGRVVAGEVLEPLQVVDVAPRARSSEPDFADRRACGFDLVLLILVRQGPAAPAEPDASRARALRELHDAVGGPAHRAPRRGRRRAG